MSSFVLLTLILASTSGCTAADGPYNRSATPDGKGGFSIGEPNALDWGPATDSPPAWENDIYGNWVAPISLASPGFDYTAMLHACYEEGCTATVETRRTNVFGTIESESSVSFSATHSEVSRSPLSNEDIVGWLASGRAMDDFHPLAYQLESLVSDYAKTLVKLIIPGGRMEEAIDTDLLEAARLTHWRTVERHEILKGVIDWDSNPITEGAIPKSEAEAATARHDLVEALREADDPCVAYAAIHVSMLLEAAASLLAESVDRMEVAKNNVGIKGGDWDSTQLERREPFRTTASWLAQDEAPLPWRVYAALQDSPLLTGDSRSAGLVFRDLATGAACKKDGTEAYELM